METLGALAFGASAGVRRDTAAVLRGVTQGRTFVPLDAPDRLAGLVNEFMHTDHSARVVPSKGVSVGTHSLIGLLRWCQHDDVARVEDLPDTVIEPHREQAV